MPTPKCFKVADIKELEKQVIREKITYSRMIEILNERADKFYKTNKNMKTTVVIAFYFAFYL